MARVLLMGALAFFAGVHIPQVTHPLRGRSDTNGVAR